MKTIIKPKLIKTDKFAYLYDANTNNICKIGSLGIDKNELEKIKKDLYKKEIFKIKSFVEVLNYNELYDF